jgi:signal transduction histidine kinase
MNRHTMHARALDRRVRACIVAPLLVDGAPIGVLRVHHTTPHAFSPEDVTLVQALADQAALAVEHARLLARSREAAVLEERTRLARDLHDSVTQSVFSASMLANAALTQYDRSPARLGGTLTRIKVITQEALSEMRALLYELHPAALAEEGLPKALEKLAAAVQVRTEVPVTFTGKLQLEQVQLSVEAKTAIFRIVQEALANALKYAQATAIRVTVVEAAAQLTVAVEDDGVGFDPAAPVTPSADGQRGGMGLRTMRERAATAGLSVHLTSAPSAGTRLLLTTTGTRFA